MLWFLFLTWVLGLHSMSWEQHKTCVIEKKRRALFSNLHKTSVIPVKTGRESRQRVRALEYVMLAKPSGARGACE